MQFSLQTLFLLVLVVGAYASLVPSYGFGRAIVCLITLLLGCSSVLFFGAALNALIEEQLRNALAAAILGALILSGATLMGTIVFHRPPEPASAFELQ